MPKKRRKQVRISGTTHTGAIHLWGVSITPAQQLVIVIALCASLLGFVGSFAVGTPTIAPYRISAVQTMQPKNEPKVPVAPQMIPEAELPVGTVLKLEGAIDAYYLGKDSLVHLFPPDGTYSSWFSKSKEIPMSVDEFERYGLGVPVRFRPGSVLIKIGDASNVYIGSKGGVLHEVTTRIATSYFGKKWQSKVRVITKATATNYTIGEKVSPKTLKKYDAKKASASVKTIDADLGL